MRQPDCRAIPDCAGPDRFPQPPKFCPPEGATDTHAHVFGPCAHYPYSAQRSYTPPEAPFSDYRSVLATLGLARAVIVQPSVHGTDNRAMLDALRSDPERLRGVAVVPEDIPEAVLLDMHDAGVRGIRINALFRGGLAFAQAQVLAERIAPMRWHLQFLIDISQTPDFAHALSRLPVDTVIDHMGHMPATLGTRHPAFLDLLALLREGRSWVKLSGPYRITAQHHPPYGDVAPFARALIAANEARVLWGSDWPHPAITRPMPNDGTLLDMLADWAPDPAQRARILVQNPARLYGFD